MSGGCLESASKVSGRRIVGVWLTLIGVSLEGVWRVYGGCLEGIHGMSNWSVVFLDVSEGQVRTGQVRTGHVRTGQVRTGQVRAGQVRTDQVKTCQLSKGPVKKGVGQTGPR